MISNIKKMIAVIMTLVILVYVGFKIYCYSTYKQNSSVEIQSVNIIGNLTINHHELNEEDYFTFNTIRVNNIFDEYRISNQDNNSIRLNKNEGLNDVKAIIIGSEEQYTNLLKEDKEYKTVFYNIIKRENIKDDVDLLKYLEKHNDDNVTFLMQSKKQKEIYIINKFKENVLPSIYYIKTIDGYYKGYYYKSTANSSEVVIIKNNKKYYFSFLGDYSEEFIIDFMSSVEIE